MADRYFVEGEITGNVATLDGNEAHHLKNVMRSKVGDPITLFDGSGTEFEGQIKDIQRREIQVAILSQQQVNRELARKITLAVALPKGERQRWLVEKCTELGVTKIVPLKTERSTVKTTASQLDKLRKFVIEASKQCGRNQLLQIAEPTSWRDYSKEESDATRFVAHPQGASIASCGLAKQQQAIVAVGPEGGFSDAEVAAARETGWIELGLGQRILRIETACAAIASYWSSLEDNS